MRQLKFFRFPHAVLTNIRSRKTLILVVSVFLLCICGYGSLFLPFPELNAFRQRDWSTRIYDRGGNIVQILALEDGVRREFTPLQEMPPEAVSIFLAAEDKSFFSHSGVDFSAILRAAYQNITSGKRISGASTITMQLARLIVPAKRRSFFAKLREARNALRIERNLTKNEILELYLNTLPFGFQTEGISSAARNFFARPLAELTKEQLCCLAVIPRRPAGYNPIEHPEACAEKAALLYRSLFPKQSSPFILSEAQDGEDMAASDPKGAEERLLEAAKTARRFAYPFYMPHYVEFLVRQYKAGAFLPSNSAGAAVPPDAEQVRTARSSASRADAEAKPPLPPEWRLTADLPFSAQAALILHSEIGKIANARLNNGALLVIDNATGDVIAWVGSNSYFDDTHGGKIDGVTARNQSGSSTKPFLYALALEHGYKPSDVLPDIPVQFGAEHIYVPRNFNNRYNGPIRLRIALASSLNIPAVSLLDEIGQETYLKTLEKLKFCSVREQGMNAGLSIALGSVPVSLYELVRAFSVFPRDGRILPLKHFKDGGTPDGFSAAETVYTPDTARLICSILSDASARVKGFGFSPTFRTPFPSLFKTGTANQYQSLVALAASSAYTIGVWMGNFSGNTVIGKTGSSIPAAVARRLLVRLHNQPLSDGTLKTAEPFAEPEHWRKEPVCALSGMRASPLCPNAVPEYLPVQMGQNHDLCPQCSWHQKKNGKIITVYPEQYRRWLSAFAQHGSIGNFSGTLTIIRPADGSRFIYDPRYKSRGIIPLEIIGGADSTAQVYYDDRPPFTLRRPFSAQLPSEKGSHRVTVRCGDGETTVRFTVE